MQKRWFDAVRKIGKGDLKIDVIWPWVVTLPAGHPVGERSEGSLGKSERCFAALNMTEHVTLPAGRSVNEVTGTWQSLFSGQ